MLFADNWDHGAIRGGIDIDARRRSRVRKSLREKGVDPGKPIISFQLGAGRRERRWDRGRAVDVIKFFNQSFDNPVLLTGSPKEHDYLAEVSQRDGIDVLNLAGVPALSGLKETITILSLSDFLVTVDTYAMHCASRLNTPFIALQSRSSTIPEGAQQSLLYQSSSISADDVIELCRWQLDDEQVSAPEQLPGAVLAYDETLPRHYDIVTGSNADRVLRSHLRDWVYARSYFGLLEDLHFLEKDGEAGIPGPELASFQQTLQSFVAEEKREIERLTQDDQFPAGVRRLNTSVMSCHDPRRKHILRHHRNNSFTVSNENSMR